MKRTTTNPLVIIGGILLMLVLLFGTVSLRKFHLLPDTYTASTFLFTRLLFWAALLFVFVYAIKIEKQPFLLWKDKNYGIGKALLFALIIVVILIVGNIIMAFILRQLKFNSNSSSMNAMISIFKENIWLLLFTCITAGITEELLFRGYLLPRLAVLFKNRTVAIIVSSLFFGLLHFSYGTFSELSGAFFIGLIFACFYSKYRNIKILIVIHFLWDLTGLLLQVYAHK